MPNLFSPQEPPSPPVDAPELPHNAQAQAKPEPQGINPVSAALTVLGIVAFALWKPDFARQAAVFLVTLGVLVLVHEWGHYQFARWAGMKVNRFGLGFPPWILTVRRNNIDYSLGALPIGGMVDIAGLGSEEEMVATTKGETVQNATRGRNPNAPFGQKQFQDASLGWRFWTLFAGPLMNFVFALVVFVGLYSLTPFPDKVTNLSTIEMVMPGTPAAQAGLLAKDKVVAVGGQPVSTSEQITKIILANADKPIQFSIEREGKVITKTVTPRVEEVTGPDNEIQKRPRIGVGFARRVDSYKRLSVVEATQAGWADATNITKQIFGLLGRAATFNLTKDDKSGVGGPVKIAQAVGETSKQGWQSSVLMAAALSVNLGLLNLLPFPALDGGRILFLGYELIMRRPLDPRKEGLVHAVGMVMLLAFMLFITVRDVVPFFQGVR